MTTILMFLSPIFYPVSAVPEKYQIFIFLNPLTFIIEQMRDVLIWGKHPSWIGICLATVLGILAAWLGLVWFQKTRKGFADVL
jgi:lipopolysaccharide transport system permease protein